MISIVSTLVDGYITWCTHGRYVVYHVYALYHGTPLIMVIWAQPINPCFRGWDDMMEHPTSPPRTPYSPSKRGILGYEYVGVNIGTCICYAPSNDMGQ